jgi:hypothetical protein
MPQQQYIIIDIHRFSSFLLFKIQYPRPWHISVNPTEVLKSLLIQEVGPTVFIHSFVLLTHCCWDSSISIMARLQDGWQGNWVGFPTMISNSLFSTMSRLVLQPTQPPMQWIPGVWIWPLIILVWYLIKYTDNFSLPLLVHCCYT